VITGYNTDIEFEGVTYHVQTEDKGLAKPVILSLVYNGGTILASKRSPYKDLLESDFDEKLLEERLHKQHRVICAAIKAGRIEELKKMNGRVGEAAAKAKLPGAAVSEGVTVGVGGHSFDLEDCAVPRPDSGELMAPIPKPAIADLADLDLIMSAAETVIEEVSVVEDGDSFVPENAVMAIDSDMAGRERPANDNLNIELLGDAKMKGGERREVAVMVCRGTERRIISQAQIMVKIIGSSFRPLIFHSATDQNGLARLNIKLPKFKSGRAALLVRVISDGEEVELRRPIAHG
jgi:hypothetical protein